MYSYIVGGRTPLVVRVKCVRYCRHVERRLVCEKTSNNRSTPRLCVGSIVLAVQETDGFPGFPGVEVQSPASILSNYSQEDMGGGT